jgi:hypothetical protein
MTVPIFTAVPTTGKSPIPVDPAPVPVPVPVPTNRQVQPGPPEAFTIDCADCRHRDTEVCDDCVVSFIVGRQPEDAVVVDADEARAVRLLEQAGLVPGVRHSRQVAGL